MEKFTNKLKAKHKDLKGKIYLFVLKANEIALANSYKKFTIDAGAKPMASYVENRLDSVFMTEGQGFWSKEYKGTDELLALVKAAQLDINDGIYSIEVIELIEGAMKSYLPKGEKRVEEEKPKFSPLEQTHIPEGVTGAKLKKAKLDEVKALEEEKDMLDIDLSLLDDDEDVKEEEEGQVGNDMDLL